MTTARSRDPRFLRRRDLLDRIMRSVAAAVADPAHSTRDADMAYLGQVYGQDEVELVFAALRDRFERLGASNPKDPDQQEADLYRRYVEAYNRYGGAGRFLSFEEEEELKSEATRLRVRNPKMETGLPPLSPAERARLDELDELLLTDSDLWAGIFPDDPPPQPREVVLPEAMQRRLDKRARRRRHR